MISLSIDVTKIPRDQVIEGKKPCKDGHTAKYLNLILRENRDGEDAYGNHGFVSVSVSKEDREAGVKGVILGNYKIIGSFSRQSATSKREEARLKDKSNGYAQADRKENEDEDLPF